MKFIKAMSLMLALLLAVSTAQAELVGHWTFDEVSGPALDSSGNGYDGAIVGTVARGQAGKIGGAYQFSGAGWVNTGVDTVTSKIINFPISISYWLSSTATTSTECAVWMGRNGADNQYLQTGINAGNANAVYRNTEFGNSEAIVDGGASHTEGDGNWHHIVAVFPDATQRFVYVDGKLGASKTFTQSYYTGTNQLAIGSNNRRSSLTDPFDGLIDDVQLYDEVLSDQAILNIYAIGLGDIATSPVPAGDAVDPTTATVLSWKAPSAYTPEVGYNVRLWKTSDATEPNVIDITNASAMPGITVSLDYDSTYSWQVNSFEPEGIAGNASDDIIHYGLIWSFTTKPSIPVITAGPFDASAAPGEAAQISLEYTSLSPATSSAWEKLPNGATEWVPASGSSAIDESGEINTVTLTIPSVELTDEGLYRCTVFNTGGSEVSGTASLVVERLLAYYAFEGNANDTNGGAVTNDGTPTVGGGNVPDITYATSLAGLGDCVVFNASTEATDPNQSYIELPLAAYPNSNIGGGVTTGTITCWVKPKSTGSVIGTFNEGLTTGFLFSVQTDTSMRIFRRNEYNNENNVYFGQNTPYNSETWYYIAATWGDEDGKVKTYFAAADGTGYIEDNVDSIPAVFNPWQYPLTIGGNNARGTVDTFFKSGSMLDDLKIYNYALAPEEVAAQFNAVTGNTICIVPDFEGNYFDANSDCIVDLSDFAEFAGSWMATGLYLP
ncbi:MAG: LamG-like jellyroll fold domain-containing protein [Phycisphaerae bacterium]